MKKKRCTKHLPAMHQKQTTTVEPVKLYLAASCTIHVPGLNTHGEKAIPAQLGKCTSYEVNKIASTTKVSYHKHLTKLKKPGLEDSQNTETF